MALTYDQRWEDYIQFEPPVVPHSDNIKIIFHGQANTII